MESQTGQGPQAQALRALKRKARHQVSSGTPPHVSRLSRHLAGESASRQALSFAASRWTRETCPRASFGAASPQTLLTNSPDVDYVLLEMELAVELVLCGCMTSVYPILLLGTEELREKPYSFVGRLPDNVQRATKERLLAILADIGVTPSVKCGDTLGAPDCGPPVGIPGRAVGQDGLCGDGGAASGHPRGRSDWACLCDCSACRCSHALCPCTSTCLITVTLHGRSPTS